MFAAMVSLFIYLFASYWEAKTGLISANKRIKSLDAELLRITDEYFRIKYEFNSTYNKIQAAACESDCQCVFNEEMSLNAMVEKIKELQAKVDQSQKEILQQYKDKLISRLSEIIESEIK